MRTEEVTRVLLVTPPAADAQVTPASAGGWRPVVASLRLRGFAPEVCDAGAGTKGIESIRADIEHAWPHVLVTSTNDAGATAFEVASAAKQIVPGVITILHDARPASLRSPPISCGAIDYVIGSFGEELSALLTRLRGEGGGPAAEPAKKVSRLHRFRFGARRSAA